MKLPSFASLRIAPTAIMVAGLSACAPEIVGLSAGVNMAVTTIVDNADPHCDSPVGKVTVNARFERFYKEVLTPEELSRNEDCVGDETIHESDHKFLCGDRGEEILSATDSLPGETPSEIFGEGSAFSENWDGIRVGFTAVTDDFTPASPATRGTGCLQYADVLIHSGDFDTPKTGELPILDLDVNCTWAPFSKNIDLTAKCDDVSATWQE